MLIHAIISMPVSNLGVLSLRNQVDITTGDYRGESTTLSPKILLVQWQSDPNNLETGWLFCKIRLFCIAILFWNSANATSDPTYTLNTLIMHLDHAALLALNQEGSLLSCRLKISSENLLQQFLFLETSQPLWQISNYQVLWSPPVFPHFHSICLGFVSLSPLA